MNRNSMNEGGGPSPLLPPPQSHLAGDFDPNRRGTRPLGIGSGLLSALNSSLN